MRTEDVSNPLYGSSAIYVTSYRKGVAAVVRLFFLDFENTV